MTKLEIATEVLNDPRRSDSDRSKAISILKRIADDAADSDCAEARRLLSKLPMGQEQEDALLERALDYQSPPLAEVKFPQRPFPWTNWNPTVQHLIELLRGEPWFIDFQMGALEFQHKPQPDYAVKLVAELVTLHGRTKSHRVRDAAAAALRDISTQLSDEAGRNAARRFLEESN